MNRTTTDYLNILLAVVEGRNLTGENSLRLAGHDLTGDDVTRLRDLVAAESWISVTERLPSTDSHSGLPPFVLVCDATTGEVTRDWYHPLTGYWGGTNHQASWTHWRPLPEPVATPTREL